MLRPWVIACVVAALVLGAALFSMMNRDLVACRNDLVEVPEPEGWRAWPILPDLGGYRIESEPGACVGHGLQCGMIETELRNASLCPRGGVSLDGWFDGNIYQSPSEIALRESNGTFVAAGHSGMSPSDEERFVIAFRPRTGPPHLVFQHLRVAGACLVLALALLRLLAGGFKARRLVRRAADYRDATRYKPGQRDESGTITFADGSPPVASTGGRGPVLVRVTGVSRGSYRVAEKTSAAEIVPGDVLMLCRELAEHERDELRRAFRTAVAIAVLLLVVAMAVSFFDALKNIS
jgi:hypothetical protein